MKHIKNTVLVFIGITIGFVAALQYLSKTEEQIVIVENDICKLEITNNILKEFDAIAIVRRSRGYVDDFLNEHKISDVQHEKAAAYLDESLIRAIYVVNQNATVERKKDELAQIIYETDRVMNILINSPEEFDGIFKKSSHENR